MTIAKCLNIISIVLGFCSGVMFLQNGIKYLSLSPKLDKLFQDLIITEVNKLKSNLWSYGKIFWISIVLAFAWLYIWLQPFLVRIYKYYLVTGTYKAHTLILTKQHLFKMPHEIASIIHNNEFYSVLFVNLSLLTLPATILAILVIFKIINYFVNIVSYIILLTSAKLLGAECDENTRLAVRLLIWSVAFNLAGTIIG